MRRVTVAIVVYDDMQSLDAVGPLEVFARTTRLLEQEPRPTLGPLYDVELVAVRRGPVRASSGLTLVAARALRQLGKSVDTVLVVGGRGANDACRDRALLTQLRRLEKRTRRFGSVCTGALVLGAAGLLEGRRATTHWRHAAELAARFPSVKVDPDAIYVKDGHLYTSAGVTAGIDLALALVEEDHGREVALGVARELVVFARRPGGQSQFSVQLAGQAEERKLRAGQRWMIAHPDADLSIQASARRCGMSVRHFGRVFAREVGETPAAWVEAMRVERARELLEESERSVEAIAADCGFGSPETMRRAFLRRVRVSPRSYRERFQSRARAVS
ncbi:MAG TPA: GlxA family transcriptional regulator [Polyangiaceae bacterium]